MTTTMPPTCGVRNLLRNTTYEWFYWTLRRQHDPRWHFVHPLTQQAADEISDATLMLLTLDVVASRLTAQA